MQKDASNSLYVVAMGKFTLLYFCTMGFYKFFWFYKNWRAIEINLGRPLFAAARSFLSPFFVHSLFKHVGRVQEEQQVEFSWRAQFLASFYVAILAGQFLLQSTIVLNEGSYLALFLVELLALCLTYYVIYQVQIVVNRVEGDPFGQENSKITLQNNLWLLLGAFIWVRSISDVYLVTTGRAPNPYLELKNESSTTSDAPISPSSFNPSITAPETTSATTPEQ